MEIKGIINTIKSFSYGILVPLFAYTGISSELIYILLVLLAIDVITGAIRECLIGKLKSRELSKGILSKMLLIIVPFVLILIGKGVDIDMTPIAKLALSTFIVAEGYSIIGNIVQIRLKDKNVVEQDAITMVLQKAQDIIKSILDGIMTKK
jgi:toxin secretion/phage lysis holin